MLSQNRKADQRLRTCYAFLTRIGVFPHHPSMDYGDRTWGHCLPQTTPTQRAPEEPRIRVPNFQLHGLVPTNASIDELPGLLFIGTLFSANRGGAVLVTSIPPLGTENKKTLGPRHQRSIHFRSSGFLDPSAEGMLTGAATHHFRHTHTHTDTHIYTQSS